MASSSSLARSKSFWHLCPCIICLDGPHLLELRFWCVWISTVRTVADPPVLDLFDTAEHVHRQGNEKPSAEADEV